MSVKIGSARIDERGKATGGQAGDQKQTATPDYKGEVSMQNWYKHSKGWVVLRPKSESVAEKIAYDMEAACNNPHIGYDQNQRDSLYNVAKKVGFDCAKVTTNCETDCSALVRVCCAYAGIDVGNIRTISEPAALVKTGEFEKLTEPKYTDSSDLLKRGDILCTPVSGHTVIVLNNGSKVIEKTGYTGTFPSLPLSRSYYIEGDGYKTLKTYKTQIKRVQALVNWINAGNIAVDGQYGPNTVKAVKEAQKKLGVTVDGSFGKKTLAAARAFKK